MLASELALTGQIRLAELSVFNWGSFDGLHSARIDPDGTLITGDNGSGKSTLIDGLMALLLPAGRNAFNIAAAQGDRSDRTLISYMRGSFGSDHDGARTRVINKREGPTHTALRALYRGDDGSHIVLAALFWTTQPSSSLADVQRLYLIGRSDYTLRELLAAFGDGNVRQLKQRLRDNSRLQVFDSGFDQYRECYHRALRIENRNAPELLARALGLKKIDDLTQLIRTLVLEPSRVREDARRAVAEFEDLRAIHKELVDARYQVEALAELPATTEAIEKLLQQSRAVGEEIQLVGDYFARQGRALWRERASNDRIRQQRQREQIEALGTRQTQAEGEERDRYADYRDAGGDRIEVMRRDLSSQRETLSRILANAGEYQKATSQLGLDDQLLHGSFQTNRESARQHLADNEEQRQQVQDRFAESAASQSHLAGELQGLQSEIAEVQSRPDSNIGTLFQRMRDELVEALGIERQQLPFIGELIDVAEDQRDWQGAIERALGGLKTTLAVPQAELARVTGWVNRRHMGVHVRLQAVREVNGSAHFKPQGFLRKLQWQQHPYREWLKHHLSRFDLECVDSSDALGNTAHAMTKEGLVQHEKGRYEKKDQQRIDDRRHWSMGFSNRSRLALLQRELEQLQADVKAAASAVGDARRALDQFEQQQRHWQTVLGFEWPDVDLPTARQSVERMQAELAVLEQGTADLAAAKVRWQEAKQRLQEIQQQLQADNKTLWAIEAQLERAQNAIDACEKRIDDDADETVLGRIAESIGTVDDQSLERIDEIERQHTALLNRQLNLLDSQRNEKASRAISIISRFRARWQVFAIDWGDKELRHCDDYLQHLQTLQSEGLPDLVEKFSRRLNLHTTQSLANIREKIESEREEIRDRIDVINRVLRRTEFKSGSHLRLKTRRESHAHVSDLEQRLKSLLNQSRNDDIEVRFQQLKIVIEILDKASNPSTAHTQESRRLLDPRYQMNFYAEEVDSANGDIRDVLESSSGKSGGEKESFAGTIVAASLAYVLTPAGMDTPVYCTVFLDEAFSNTAEAVSRRVLKIFRELKIHINLITPYKNLNLARESARSLLIAERNADTHESRLCEVTWEEIDRQREQQQQRTQAAAEQMGIVVEKA